jgi:hypothetical protein
LKQRTAFGVPGQHDAANEIGRIQAQLSLAGRFSRTVTRETGFRQNGSNIPLKIHSLSGPLRERRFQTIAVGAAHQCRYYKH